MSVSYDHETMEKMDRAYLRSVEVLFGTDPADEKAKDLIASSILFMARTGNKSVEQMALYAISSARLILEDRLASVSPLVLHRPAD